MADGFQQRSGCFQCGICGRNTRRTAKQGNTGLCPHCDQWAMIENGISDGNYDGNEEVAEPMRETQAYSPPLWGC